jgi:hypothetical protein
MYQLRSRKNKEMLLKMDKVDEPHRMYKEYLQVCEAIGLVPRTFKEWMEKKNPHVTPWDK